MSSAVPDRNYVLLLSLVAALNTKIPMSLGSISTEKKPVEVNVRSKSEQW